MIELKNISVTFRQKDRQVQAVKDVDLAIEEGDIYGIVGYSGAGKSTLVRVINLLQRPTGGQVTVGKVALQGLSSRRLREERKKIGMIFQHFNLMHSRTVFNNVAFPLQYDGENFRKFGQHVGQALAFWKWSGKAGEKLTAPFKFWPQVRKERRQKVLDLLELVGIADKAEAYPSQLSGGQKQRVAIARALASNPKILLCDEATSALDPKTTLQILDLLKELNQKLGLTIVLITHEMQVVKEICNKVAVMENGEVIEAGSVVPIFSQPAQALTRDFIRTATHVDQALATILSQPKFSQLKDDEWLVELSYLGDETDEPLIVTLYSLFNVTANILHGNVEIIDNTPIGNLIVTLAGAEADKEAAVAYIKEQGVNLKFLKRPNSAKDYKGGAKD